MSKMYLGGCPLKKFVIIFILLSIITATAFFFLKPVLWASGTSPRANPTEVKKLDKQDTIAPKRCAYNIDTVYNGRNLLQSEMDFTYVNDTEDVLDELYFHLYPNMFNTKSSVPFFPQDFSRAFPKGFSQGGIAIKSITQDGKELSWDMIEANQILKLSLQKPVDPSNYSTIHIKFDVTIPDANFRFGYQTFNGGKITTSLANWYPILAVYKDGKWAIDKHQALGDCSHSEIADYDVKFVVPKNFVVAASGVLEEQFTENNETTFVYSVSKIREFGASMSNNYEIAEDMVDGIKIISYFHPEDKQGGFMALNVAKYALGIFNKSFAKYPYPELRIAEANYYLGGMEFPTFIMMSSARYKEPNLSNTTLERSTAHEVAHQWWYGLVGSDQINEPWMDEGLTEFSTAYYFEKRYGTAGREAYFGRQVDTTIGLIRNSKRHMLDPVTKFSHQSEYFPVVYVSGVLFYEDFRNRVGEDKFLEFLRSYLETYKYKVVSFKEFEEFLRGKKYEALDESFYEKWF